MYYKFFENKHSLKIEQEKCDLCNSDHTNSTRKDVAMKISSTGKQPLIRIEIHFLGASRWPWQL